MYGQGAQAHLIQIQEFVQWVFRLSDFFVQK